jgi:hypothetical protein
MTSNRGLDTVPASEGVPCSRGLQRTPPVAAPHVPSCIVSSTRTAQHVRPPPSSHAASNLRFLAHLPRSHRRCLRSACPTCPATPGRSVMKARRGRRQQLTGRVFCLRYRSGAPPVAFSLSWCSPDMPSFLQARSGAATHVEPHERGSDRARVARCPRRGSRV